MKQQVIDGIRNYYDLPDQISDEYIKSEISNTFGANIVKLDISIKNFKKSLFSSMPNFTKKFSNKENKLMKTKIETKKRNIDDIIRSIREEIESMKNIIPISKTYERIGTMLGEMEEILDDEIYIPPIKCPACTNQSGISKGCIICNMSGRITNPIEAE